MFTYKAIRRTFFFADHYQPTHQGVKYLIFWINSSCQIIPWENCTDICTDGAKAMRGHNVGVIAKIKANTKNCSSSHCVLHRHALASRKMHSELMVVLNDAIKIMNYIKSQPLKSRIFKVICEDMGSHHQSLLLNTEVRGKGLTRLMELHADVAAFLMEYNALLATALNDED
ncbi:hypothetical protein PR048_001651 [Dryococelus australis]|uniref:Zinc finger BED domain-containing protein 5 n=1 Tax=Dryococelus australis TaxID=614101 RepID=A0ABQ9II20_9NEOP|nr:hypothetical protein PR048_001651 [Dryococelus australis]